VAGATFPALIWHDFMSVAKGGFCGKFPRPIELAELKPYCGRLSVTRNCAPRPADVQGGSVGTAPAEATGGQVQPGSTAAAPQRVPIPDTAVLRGPPSQTAARSAVFKFRSQGAASKGYECSVDGGPFTTCSSPASYGRLAPGPHVFAVRALSKAGEPDQSPATYSWSVFEDLVPQSAQPQQAPTPQPQSKPKSKPQQPVLVG
jgi:hypothetical protein